MLQTFMQNLCKLRQDFWRFAYKNLQFEKQWNNEILIANILVHKNYNIQSNAFGHTIQYSNKNALHLYTNTTSFLISTSLLYKEISHSPRKMILELAE